MIDRHLPARFFVLSIFLAWASAASCGEWPRWRGPANTGRVPETEAVPVSLPESPKVLWSVKMGEGVGSPVVSNQRVFCLDSRNEKEVLVAYSLEDGKELWNAPIDAIITDGMGSSPRGTPVVDGPRVFVQSCRGNFHCLNAADGKPLWHVNFVKDFEAIFIGEKGLAAGASRHGYTGPPLVDGERVYVGVGGQHGASIVCFEKASGKVVWKSQDDIPGYGGPVIAEVAGVRHLLSFAADALVGLNAANGKLLWRVPIKTSYGRHVTTPVASNDTVVVSSHEAGLMGVRISGEPTALKAETAWKSQELAINFADPVLIGRHLYGLGPKKKLFCLDVETGKETWTQSKLLGSPAGFASILIMKDNLFILDDSGKGHLVAADPKECRVIGSTKLCGKNWCNPAYVDGKMLIRDHETLRCVQLLP